MVWDFGKLHAAKTARPARAQRAFVMAEDLRYALILNDPAQLTRLGGARQLCGELGLDCRRIRPPAMDHAAVLGCMARSRANCSKSRERQRQCQAMTPKECSILLAHAMAWRAVSRAAVAALVLEDDAARSSAIGVPQLRASLRREPAAHVAQLGLCLPDWCFDQKHCDCRALEGQAQRGVACRGLCAHAYRITPEGAALMLRRQATWSHAKVDLLFPHAPMLGPAGGVEPCKGGGAIHGDVGALCQNRTIAPMHDPALGPHR